MTAKEAQEKLVEAEAAAERARLEVLAARDRIAEGSGSTSELSRTIKAYQRTLDELEGARANVRVALRLETEANVRAMEEAEQSKREAKAVATKARAQLLVKYREWLTKTAAAANDFDQKLFDLNEAIGWRSGHVPRTRRSWTDLTGGLADQIKWTTPIYPTHPEGR